MLGNVWFLDNGSGAQTFYQDTTAFGSGSGMGRGGSNPSGFGFGGANGCQSDADTGLVLMGYRYYDPRIGRFISQDPAGDGDNWYAYCGNNPVNNIDPSGLSALNIFCAPSAHGEGPCGNWGFFNADQLDTMFGGQSDPSQPQAMDQGKKSKKPKTSPTFKTADAAGMAAVKAAYPESNQDANEFWGWILETKNFTYQYTTPQPTPDVNGFDSGYIPVPPPPGDDVVAGWYHTHPESIEGGINRGDSFSEGDLGTTQFYNEPGYLATPNFILKATPASGNGTPTVTTLQAQWH